MVLMPATAVGDIDAKPLLAATSQRAEMTALLDDAAK